MIWIYNPNNKRIAVKSVYTELHYGKAISTESMLQPVLQIHPPRK